MNRIRMVPVGLIALLAMGAPLQAEAREVRGTTRTSVNRDVSANASRSVDRDVSRDVDRDVHRDIDVDRDVDVDVHGGYGYYGRDIDIDVDDDYHPVATAVAVGAAAAVVGSIVASVPPDCQTVQVGNVAYEQCGSSWYQPRMTGTQVTYVVVDPPH